MYIKESHQSLGKFPSTIVARIKKVVLIIQVPSDARFGHG
jgi:hypothetical protein